MEKNSSIILSDAEKALIRADIIPERFIGWYTLDELKDSLINN